MKPVLEQLQREWYAKARAAGFHDIEAPSGIISRKVADPMTVARGAAREAHLEKARAYLETHQFHSALDRMIWEGHCAGLSSRQLAKHIGIHRRKVDACVQRYTAAMERPRRGRRKEEDSLRSEGLRYELRLTPVAAEALQFIRGAGELSSVAPLLRKEIVSLALRISVRTEL